MHLPRVNVTGRLATMAVVATLLAWSANADAAAPVRAALAQAVHAGFQDEEEYPQEYAEEADPDEEGESDAGEYADEEYESSEDGASDTGEYADETYESGEEVAPDGDEYVDDDDAGLPEDYADDSWATELAEDESDDAIPIDDETWGEDVAWDVVEEAAVDEGDGAGDAGEDSDEDVVGGGEMAVVRPATQGPASKGGSVPTRSQASRPGRGPGQWGTQGKGRRTKGAYGGRPVSALSVPWQAEIFDPRVKSPSADGKPAWARQHYCGGALIAPDWVLTAAHCINPKMVALGFKVRLGMTDLSKGDGLTYRIDRIVRHSQYDPDNNDPAKPPNMYANDIALIRIADDGPPRARDPQRIRPIPLNRKPLPAGAPVSVTGWGVTGTGAADKASAVILRVDLQLMDTPVCQARPKFGPQKIHDKVFCAAHPERSTCRGDSGGPVVLTNDEPVLVGVVSWGKKQCAGDGKPGVYTRVDRYLDWIDKAMKLPPDRTALP